MFCAKLNMFNSNKKYDSLKLTIFINWAPSSQFGTNIFVTTIKQFKYSKTIKMIKNKNKTYLKWLHLMSIE